MKDRRQGGRKQQKSEVDFWAKVAVLDPPGTCWPWRGGCDRAGYGWFIYRSKQYRAHRLAFQFANADPGDLHVLHRCDNPPCCNPAHLFLGTQADNNADMMAKGRHRGGARPRLVE